MLGLKECFTSEFEDELPEKEKDAFDLDTSEGRDHAAAVKKNKKAMMQFALSFQKVAQLNKLNRATRVNKDWPSGKAHEVMAQLVKEYKPDDTMAKMEMEKALSKLTLNKKKDPNNINDELSAIECRYKIDLSESKKKAQVLRIGGAQYSSVIATTQMIYKSKGADLTCKKLLEEMHNQWRIAGNKSHDEKDSDNEDEVVATATEKESRRKKKPYINPDKEKTCNRCKKKGHVENRCWKKNPELIPDKVKAAQKKQAEKKSKKVTAAVNNEMILILDRQEFNINDAFTSVPTDKSRGSGPFVPSIYFFFGAPLFPLSFVLAGIANTQS
jgi:hypothetical protein